MSPSTPRRLLLVTYEFPPSAGGGVQRLAKLAKHLPRHGWRVTVVAAEPIEGRPRDETLLADVSEARVVRLPARDVGAGVARAISPVKRLVRRRGASEQGRRTSGSASSASGVPLSTRLARWVAVPDTAVRWAAGVEAAARRLHAEEPFDAVLASGPPYSGVAAAASAGRALSVPFVADMRDAWLVNPSVRWPTAWHAHRSQALERATLAAADAVTAVSEVIAEEARSLGARRVLVVPNGFDPEDLPPRAPDRAGPLRLAFMGRLYRALDPATLVEGLGLALRGGRLGEGFAVDVVGPPSAEAEALVRRHGLGEVVRFHGFKPHAEALGVVAAADAALVSVGQRPGAEGIYTGKLFEYVGMGVPVLLVGPADGVAARLLHEAGAGRVTRPGDAPALAEAVASLAEEKRSGGIRSEPDPAVVARFERGRQAAQVAAVLDSLAGCPAEERSEVSPGG